MHTVTALLCFVVVIHWLIFPYPSGLLHWQCGNLTIAPVPAKQPWWIWINTSCEFIMNDCITITKQSTTKPCAYFLGYTVLFHISVNQLSHRWFRKWIAACSTPSHHLNQCRLIVLKIKMWVPRAHLELGAAGLVPGGLWGPTRPGIHHPALGKHLNFYYSPCFTIDKYNLRCVRPQNTTKTAPRPHSQLSMSWCRRWRHSNQREAPGGDTVMLTVNLRKWSIWGAILAS